ncbi:MAG: nicotinate-nicotinamide nucleotide adenylyltransferase, partial [Oceanicaulis sp.]|nr:nicotinate-nicotinamide nucleotide adenylyltransferase [Oceanicaulis sp.]
MMAGLKSELLAPGLRVGLYGGTFDPPHAGHLHVARSALRRLQLDRVWWLVSPGNPFKPHPPAPLAERLDAVRALAPGPRHVVSALEAQLSSHRTVDVIAWLQARHRGVRFVWIMGSDGLAELHRWKAWREIIARVPLAVIARPIEGPDPRFSPAARALAGVPPPETPAPPWVSKGAPGWTIISAQVTP